MSRAAKSDRLRQHCADLAAAVEAVDLARIASLDHAIRSTVMAMLGEGAPDGPAAAEEAAVLRIALEGLGEAVRCLRVAQGQAQRKHGARALYLAPKRPVS
jgi:hypothetical protein